MRKVRTKTCKNCNVEFDYTDNRKIFCTHKCSAIYNNSRRTPMSEAQKIKLSESSKKAWAEKRENFSVGEKHSKAVGKGTKGKHKIPNSILDVSSRTVSKIMKRLNKGCSLCGWNKGTCDIHHINGRKIEDANGHWNLTYICPNCHREYHSGNAELKEKFVSLLNYIGDEWKEYYYG